MPEIETDFPRAWVEFDDPEDADQIIKADLTWLTSRWHCIFGSGCKGIDAAIPSGGCCTLGAHFSDSDDVDRVTGAVGQLTQAEWELHPTSDPQPSDWLEVTGDGESKTIVHEGGCVFLNSPDFVGGGGCALHLLANRLGVSHVTTKPDVCWQLPIRREYEERKRADGVEKNVVVITEYVRGMWGPGGHDLDWYCSSNTEAHTAAEPVYQHSRDELVELLGRSAYDELVILCQVHETARLALVSTGAKAAGLTPHPADPM